MWEKGCWRKWQKDFNLIIVSSTSRTEMRQMIQGIVILPTIEIEAVLNFPFSSKGMLCLVWSLYTGSRVFISKQNTKVSCASKLLRDENIEVATESHCSFQEFLCGSLLGLSEEIMLHFSIWVILLWTILQKLLKIQWRDSPIMYQSFKRTNLPSTSSTKLCRWVKLMRRFNPKCRNVPRLTGLILPYCSFRISRCQPILHFSILAILLCTIIRKTGVTRLFKDGTTFKRSLSSTTTMKRCCLWSWEANNLTGKNNSRSCRNSWL